MTNPPPRFQLQAQDFSFVGADLARPECVLCGPGDTLWVSDQRASAMRIMPDGSQALWGPRIGTPNGLALARDGSLYVADIEAGCVYRVSPVGSHTMIVDDTGGAANFVFLDERDRLWITVCTAVTPRSQALAEPIADGRILRCDREGKDLCVAASGLCFVNEVRIDRSGRFLYAVETARGRVQRYALDDRGNLHDGGVMGGDPLFEGARPDGVSIDAQGNLWLTELTRNAILLMTPAGDVHTVFEDPSGAVLDLPTSLAFGGADGRTVYVGSLRMKRLASFRAPWPGAPLHHRR